MKIGCDSKPRAAHGVRRHFNGCHCEKRERFCEWILKMDNKNITFHRNGTGSDVFAIHFIRGEIFD